MRSIIMIALGLATIEGNGQISQIYSGTSTTLMDLSVINKNISICGYTDYMVMSINECNSLAPLSVPVPTNYANRLQRIDTNTLYLLSLSFSPEHTQLHKSIDGGFNWIKKLDTGGISSTCARFFNSQEGIVGSAGAFNKIMRTLDGGSTWTTNPSPLFSIDVMQNFGDSMIIIGGISTNGFGVFYLSKNRGHSWPLGGSLGALGKAPSAFYFLSKDTIFGVSESGGFTKTINGGQNWDNSATPPIVNSYNVFFKNAKEGYVVGNDNQNFGIIIKTTDFGKTWSTFNTGIKTSLKNIALLNDSMALLTGTEGVILKWNYKNTIFTGVKPNFLDPMGLRIFPNPLTTVLNFDVINLPSGDIKLSLKNALGQTVYEKENLNQKEQVDISFLKAGIYFLTIKTSEVQTTIKLVKE